MEKSPTSSIDKIKSRKSILFLKPDYFFEKIGKIGLEVAFGEIGAGKLLMMDAFLVAGAAILAVSSCTRTALDPNPKIDFFGAGAEVGDCPRLTYLRLL